MIKGELRAVFFENKQNYYKVLLIGVEDTDTNYEDDEIVVTGNFGQIKEGVNYQFFGDLVQHPKYGMQFQCRRYEQEKPSSHDALVNFFSGHRFKGIGKVTATHIVETLGTNAIDAIMEDPKILDEVTQLTPQKREMVIRILDEDQGSDKIILTLNRYGLGNQLAYKIYQVYEETTLDIIHNNPYQLVHDINNFGFQRADQLAEAVGIKNDDPKRLQAAIFYAVYLWCMGNGDTYLETRFVLDEATQLLNRAGNHVITKEQLHSAMEEAVSNGLLMESQGRYYLPSLFAAEWGIVSSLEKLQSLPLVEELSEDDILEELAEFEEENGIEYGPSQRDAIVQALSEPVFILTGGPGTGKTTVVNAIVQLYARLMDLDLDPHTYKEDEPYPILLAAPTGRAAKRMNETTEMPASTIHRLLGFTGDEDMEEEMEERNKVQGELLIIDEMSMVDTWLFNQLLKHLDPSMRIILIGDQDQLPSVGPGQILSDLIASEEIPLVELTDVYRQAGDSSIIHLAHQIKNNVQPLRLDHNFSDRSFIKAQTHQIESVVSQVVSRAVSKEYDIMDVQVLAPMYKGQAGIDQLNTSLQNVINPNDTGRKKEVKHFDKVYRIGDKVLQLVNENERKVYNGDLGKIVGIITAKESENKTEEVVIQFDDIEVTYPRNEWDKFSLAYAMSIHKAQGSEFEMVILPFVSSYSRMLKKDLLYTAITRASRFLILIGEERAFNHALTQSSANRKTTLAEYLQADAEKITELFKLATVDRTAEVNTDITEENKDLSDHSKETESLPKDKKLTPDLIDKLRIPARIGMGDMTPYDF